MRLQPQTSSLTGVIILLIIVIGALLFMFAPVDKTLETIGYIITHNSIYGFLTSNQVIIGLPILLILSALLYMVLVVARQ